MATPFAVSGDLPAAAGDDASINHGGDEVAFHCIALATVGHT
jgi:hypothetical protein